MLSSKKEPFLKKIKFAEIVRKRDKQLEPAQEMVTAIDKDPFYKDQVL